MISRDALRSYLLEVLSYSRLSRKNPRTRIFGFTRSLKIGQNLKIYFVTSGKDNIFRIVVKDYKAESNSIVLYRGLVEESMDSIDEVTEDLHEKLLVFSCQNC